MQLDPQTRAAMGRKVAAAVRRVLAENLKPQPTAAERLAQFEKDTEND
jgi:hypothetical protein